MRSSRVRRGPSASRRSGSNWRGSGPPTFIPRLDSPQVVEGGSGYGTTVGAAGAGRVRPAPRGRPRPPRRVVRGTIWENGWLYSPAMRGFAPTILLCLAVHLARPVDAQAPTVTQIAASWHILALLSDGTVSAMGDNRFGQLGDGSSEGRAAACSVLRCTRENGPLHRATRQRPLHASWRWRSDCAMSLPAHGTGQAAALPRPHQSNRCQ